MHRPRCKSGVRGLGLRPCAARKPYFGASQNHDMHRQQHRGRHPSDDKLFAPAQWKRLRQAVGDLSWLLSRDYPLDASLKLVGDRYRLTARQRMAVRRCACSDKALVWRTSHRIGADVLRGKTLWVDGLNVLIGIESALSGGLLFLGRDGCLRDLASVHGTWRRVVETRQAIYLLGQTLGELAPAQVHILLDKPVGNSGRLRGFLQKAAEEQGWPWTITLDHNPDRLLVAAAGPVATSDSHILDQVQAWVHLIGHVVQRHVPQATIIDLRPA